MILCKNTYMITVVALDIYFGKATIVRLFAVTYHYISFWSVLLDISLEILKRFCTENEFFHLDFNLKHLGVCNVWHQ